MENAGETLTPAEGTLHVFCFVFLKSQDNKQPPDQMMTRLIGLMENIMKDVELLKFFQKSQKTKLSNLVIVKRSNKVIQALNLPKVLNLNPRSAMNKIDELQTFIEEESIDCAFISESHDNLMIML